MILDVTKERVQSAWYLFDDVVVEGAVTESFAAAYSVQSGTTRVVEDDQAAPPLADPAPFA
jgi:hypothetical protein